MRVLDLNAPDQAQFLKAAVYGPPGTGKTTFGVSAPRPLILLSEMQAIQNIKRAARMHGVAQPATLAMESLGDYRAVIRAFRGDRTKPFIVRSSDATQAVLIELAEWPQTVVIDSLTDVCKLVADEIREESPPKIGSDGLPVDSERYWNVLFDRCEKFIRGFRDVPAHVVFLSLLDERPADAEKGVSAWTGPSFPMRKLPNVLMAAVNVVGITYRKQVPIIDPSAKPNAKPKTVMEYGIATAGADHFQVKPFPPLRKNEVTDFSSWVKRVNGVDDQSTPPPPMEGPAEPITQTQADNTQPAAEAAAQ